MALQGASDVAQELQPRVEIGAEIDQRPDRLAIRKQRLAVKWGNVSSVARKLSAQISRPSFLTRQLSVMCPPTMSSPCAARPRTSHSRASSSRSGRKFDLRLPAKACAIEDDCFLREPGELGSLAGFQPCHDARGLVQCPIDLFSRLGGHRDRRFGERRDAGFEAVSTGDAACGIDKHSLFQRAVADSREQDADRRALKELDDPRPAFRAAQYDAAAAFGPLQIAILDAVHEVIR